jgi:imidazolonepropionase-like amidohydrolase
MVDVKSGAVTRDVVVIVEGERIKAVGPKLPLPSGARVFDLGAATLLPGLIDAHTHLLDNRVGSADGAQTILLAVAQMSTAKRALLGAAMAREDLEAGFTTVRDLGNSGVNGAVALRDAIDSNWVVGPRMIAATRALAPVGGQFGSLAPEAQPLVGQEYAIVSSVDDARRSVRQALYDGADVIKVIVNAGSRVLSLAEVTAVVDEAHRAGKKVAAHASGDEATRIAAQAGVDSIEHGYVVPDDVLKIMAAKGIFLVPTDAPKEAYFEIAFNGRTPAADERAAAEQGVGGFVTASRHRLMRARQAGVRIGAGSDMYLVWPGKTRGEASKGMLSAYADAGLPLLEVIRAATINNADLLGRSADLGSIETGKLADLIAVAGDPLTAVDALERIRFIMKGGQVIVNRSSAR